MLELYLVNSLDGVVYFNDAYFNSGIYHGSIRMNKQNIDILLKVDGFRYTKGIKGISKYGQYEIPLTSVSTGCKTLINICSDLNKIFYIGECGNNVLKMIFNLDKGRVCMNRYFVPPKFNKDIAVFIGNSERYYLVHGSHELTDLLEKVYRG